MTILVAQSEQEAIRIPEWVADLASFRRWACSDEFPALGWYSHLNGELWVDASMERIGHNQIRTDITIALGGMIQTAGIGRYISDRMLLTNQEARLSTEPDGTFLSYETVREGRATLKKGRDSAEIDGTPDMVLEIISPTSRQKDQVILPALYHDAGIPEYWLIDEHGDDLDFKVLAWKPGGYEKVPPDANGWRQSPVFKRAFKLVRAADEMGPCFHLQIR